MPEGYKIVENFRSNKLLQDMIHRNEQRILQFYQMSRPLTVDEVWMKHVHGSGDYYIFHVHDSHGKKTEVKIDSINPPES